MRKKGMRKRIFLFYFRRNIQYTWLTVTNEERTQYTINADITSEYMAE